MDERLRDYGELVVELYEEIAREPNCKSIEIVWYQAPFSDGAATFADNGDGTYKIYIKEGEANEFNISHELLHIYLRVHNLIPSMISCHPVYSKTSVFISLLLADFTSHKWIIEEQLQRSVKGVEDFQKTHYDSITNMTQVESGTPAKDFLIIKKFYVFLNDYPNYQPQLLPKIESRYPISFVSLIKLLSVTMEKSVVTPFYLHRKLSKLLFIWKDIFSEFQVNIDVEIQLKAVLREEQLCRKATSFLYLNKTINAFCFMSVKDKQRFSRFYPLEKYDHNELTRDMNFLTLKEFFEKYGVEYYFDDRNGNWELKS